MEKIYNWRTEFGKFICEDLWESDEKIDLIRENAPINLYKYKRVDDNTIDWRYHHDVDYSNYGYSYSTLTELPNHEIGLMFEKFDSWSRNELHMKNVVPYITFKIEDLKKN